MSDILAIDMGKNKSVYCDYDSATGVHEFGTLATGPREFEGLVKRLPGRRVVIEVSPLAGWVSDLCRTLGRELKVVNTTGEAWKWNRVKDKSDRADGLKIARMEAMGQHRYVHLPGAPVRRWRELIAYRDDLVRRSTASKNRIRALFDRQGERWPAGKKGWTIAALEEMAKLATPLEECGGDDQLWRGMLHEELACLRHTRERVEAVEAKLDAMAEGNERVRRLTSTPGVGNRTAEMVVATLDDPKRFKNVAQVGSCTGLTPRRLQSGEMDRQLGISHAGSRLLRKLLVQAAWIGQQHNPWMKEAFERIGGGKKDRRKKAVVAVARQLFVRLWAMDRDGTEWKDPATTRTGGPQATPA
jgi:transposase